MEDKFRRLAERIAHMAGTSWSFALAICLILMWALTGPAFGFSDTWQLVINSSTTIITFLMVFLIQNTQNRDAIAVQLKLDELLRVVKGARTGMINVDQLSNAELERLRNDLAEIGRQEGCDLASIEAKITSRSESRSESPGAAPTETRSERTMEVEIETKPKGS